MKNSVTPIPTHPMNPMKAIVKALIPQKLRSGIRWCLSENYRDRLLWEKDREMGQWVYGLTGGKVIAGPFAGLKYVDTARGSSIGPKLLGTYELELREIVDGIVARGYSTIINIGAGEGYYSIGLAKRMPQTRFLCFDALPDNQKQIKHLAGLNGLTDRIEVEGYCDAASLSHALQGSANVLVICDIEGGEIEVLDPAAVPLLGGADMLVEMHDIVRKGCTETLATRFSKSHKIEVIPTRRRKLEDFPANLPADKKQKLEAMEEHRGPVPMTFFWMRAKPSASVTEAA